MPYLIHIEFDDYNEPVETIYSPPENDDQKAISYAGNMSMWIDSLITVTEMDENLNGEEND